MNPDKVVTRFPPSPTGDLHLGGARTALFNWLYARRHGGKFILRIEDTDRQRSTDEATAGILQAMEWLGLDWDEGPYFQSQRTEIYQAKVNELLEKGEAYWCHCSAETLKAKREAALAAKKTPVYDLTCREKNLGPAEGAVVRLKTPGTGSTAYNDLVMGPLRFDNTEMDDLVILRSDGSPTYHLACVVDDVEMGLTHIIRGQDHVKNTPRQILIYKALDAEIPQFGHVPMIHGADGGKLSKRHGATNVMAYRDMGYLPEAMLNYLVRLGWSHGDEEVFGPERLKEIFDLEHIGKSPGVFNQEKLIWLNQHYITEYDNAKLAGLLLPFFEKAGVAVDAEALAKVVEMFKPRAKVLPDFVDQARFLFEPITAYEAKGEKKAFKPEAAPILENLAARLKGSSFDEADIEARIRAMSEEEDLKLGAIAQPARLALTGKTASPGIFEVIAALGEDKTTERLIQGAARIRAVSVAGEIRKRS